MAQVDKTVLVRGFMRPSKPIPTHKIRSLLHNMDQEAWATFARQYNPNRSRIQCRVYRMVEISSHPQPRIGQNELIASMVSWNNCLYFTLFF